MKGNLVIIVKKNSYDIIYAVSAIPIASITRKYRNIKELKHQLQSFLVKNKIGTTFIKNILIVTDFSDLIVNKRKYTFGYIKIGYIQKTTLNKKRLLNGTEFNIYDFNIHSIESENKKNDLREYLRMLKNKGIKEIAINSDFSTLDPNKEKDLICYINKICPNTFTIKGSYSYNVFNFVLRQNMLFLDLMLHDIASKFSKSMNEIFYDLGINSPVYYMKGNGRLMSPNLALTCPFFTWQSIFTSNLIGSSIHIGEENAFVLTPYNNEIKMGIIQNTLPKLDDTLSYYQGLQIPNFYPKYTFFKTLPSNSKWNKFIKHNNIFNGSSPLINLFDKDNNNYFFNHKLINIENHPTIIAEGALNSTYELELTSTISSSDLKFIEIEKNKLRKKAEELLNNNTTNFQSISYDFKLIPIKYMPKNSIFLKLFVTGKIY